MSVAGSRAINRFFIPWLLLVLQLFVTACTASRRAAPAVPRASNRTPQQGTASITILTGSKSTARNEEIVPPRPVGALETPAYPEAALKAHYGQATVAVRVFLDEAGSITGIQNAPCCPSTGGRFAAEFRSAVDDAIRHWKFQPAEYRRYAEGKDLNGDGKPDYQVVVTTKPVPVYIDVRFDFSIVKGRGRVNSRASSSASLL